MRHEVLCHAVVRVVQQYFQWFTCSSPRQVAPDGDAANQAGSGEQVSDMLILAPGTLCRCSILTNLEVGPHGRVILYQWLTITLLPANSGSPRNPCMPVIRRTLR